MAGFSALSPNINVNTGSKQLRTELQNTFARLDGQLQLAPYRLAAQVGAVSCVSNNETTLYTTNINIGTFAKNATSIQIFACGTTAANANNKTIKLYFNDQVLLDTGAFAGNDIDWTMQAEIVRNTADAQAYWAECKGSATLSTKIAAGTLSEDLAVNQTISITGQGSVDGDVSALYWKLLLLT